MKMFCTFARNTECSICLLKNLWNKKQFKWIPSVIDASFRDFNCVGAKSWRTWVDDDVFIMFSSSLQLCRCKCWYFDSLERNQSSLKWRRSSRICKYVIKKSSICQNGGLQTGRGRWVGHFVSHHLLGSLKLWSLILWTDFTHDGRRVIIRLHLNSNVCPLEESLTPAFWNIH